jgi:ElaB/YqjD/DUF883 family membrane-anchored ribosome-binding protein
VINKALKLESTAKTLDQIKNLDSYCKTKADNLRQQAETLRKSGKTELAAKKERQAGNYDKVREKIRDAGITTEEAIFYRKHPTIATAMDIVKTSHEAGLEGGKYGAAIGGTVSLVKNLIACMQDDKEFGEALIEVTVDTGKSAAVGYSTAFVGSTAKSLMQQAESTTLRALSKTSLPTLAVTVCIELASSIKKLAQGKIDNVQFLEEIGEKGAGLLSSGLMATAFVMAVPGLPVIAASLLGGMIGYTLSSLFYHSALEAFQEAKEARANYLMVKAQCEEARRQIKIYQEKMQIAFDERFNETKNLLDNYFKELDYAVEHLEIDDFAIAANNFANFFGKKMQFDSMAEFECFMESDEILYI